MEFHPTQCPNQNSLKDQDFQRSVSVQLPLLYVSLQILATSAFLNSDLGLPDSVTQWASGSRLWAALEAPSMRKMGNPLFLFVFLQSGLTVLFPGVSEKKNFFF